jgi:hypothetical protein
MARYGPFVPQVFNMQLVVSFQPTSNSLHVEKFTGNFTGTDLAEWPQTGRIHPNLPSHPLDSKALIFFLEI